MWTEELKDVENEHQHEIESDTGKGKAGTLHVNNSQNLEICEKNSQY